MNCRGFTLLEVLIAMAIASVAVGVITYYAVDLSNFGTDLSTRLDTERELELTLRTMLTEIRSMGNADNGAYPIATATGTTFTFFSDVDGDGKLEQVRYFLDGTTLKKGITHATGSAPPVYDQSGEDVTEVVHSMSAGQTVFSYYPDGYPPETGALPAPVDVSKIRAIGISGTVDKDPNQPPLPVTLSITVTIRNLRGQI